MGNRYHPKPRGARGENSTPGSRMSWRWPSRDRGQRRGVAGINTLTSVYCHLLISCLSLSLRSDPRGRQRPGSWVIRSSRSASSHSVREWGEPRAGLGEGRERPLFPSGKRRTLSSASRGRGCCWQSALSSLPSWRVQGPEPSPLWVRHLGNNEELLRVWGTQELFHSASGGLDWC